MSKEIGTRTVTKANKIAVNNIILSSTKHAKKSWNLIHLQNDHFGKQF